MSARVYSYMYFFTLKYSKFIGSILLVASLALVINSMSKLTLFIGMATQIELINIVLELAVSIITLITGLLLIIVPHFFTSCDLEVMSPNTHKIINNVISPLSDIIS
ncbi:hypothetical protein WCE14_15170 [Acinetobacter schindleri]|nr:MULTISPECIES: hypothetical protein [Acinetobacter]